MTKYKLRRFTKVNCPTPQSELILRVSAKPTSQIRRVIIKDRQICLTCRSVIISNGRIIKSQPLSKPYKHGKGCSQADKF
jgi:hypothetical protein